MQKESVLYVYILCLFALLTGMYLAFNETGHVLWEIYAHGLKDSFIVALALERTMRSKDLILKFATIALVSYLAAPMCIRIYCAFKSDFIYKIYREVLKNNSFKLILMLILFAFFSLLYVEILKYDKKRER